MVYTGGLHVILYAFMSAIITKFQKSALDLQEFYLHHMGMTLDIGTRTGNSKEEK